ncbi:MAG: hypothetical protein R3D52_09100 [Xanthobacteraceae bacterium]
MSETASEPSAPVQRMVVTMAAVFAGVIVVAAVALWAHYGTAVFYEVILAGLNACF